MLLSIFAGRVKERLCEEGCMEQNKSYQIFNVNLVVLSYVTSFIVLLLRCV
jgi:hypothetical protein